MMRFRPSISILIVICVLTLSLGALVFLRSRSFTSQSGSSSATSEATIPPCTSGPPTARGVSDLKDGSPSSAPLGQLTRQTYSNAEYDFSFTYPAVLGDVIVAREPGEADAKSGCRGAGERFHGSFVNNPNVDFGFVTADYRDCSNQPVSLFDVIGLDVRDRTLAFATSGGAESFELPIEKVLPTASPGVVAYVVKNTVDADARGTLAAVVKSPIKKIGALVFRTTNLSAADALTILEDI